MFRIVCLVLLLLPVSGHADEWRDGDTYREIVFQSLNIVDWGQTRYIAAHPDYGVEQPGKYHESDSAWLIGRNPSTTDVDRMMIAASVLHFVISYNLPHEWREAFQYVFIGAKLDAVVGNASIGVKFGF